MVLSIIESKYRQNCKSNISVKNYELTELSKTTELSLDGNLRINSGDLHLEKYISTKDEIIPDSMINGVHPENGKYNVYVEDFESRYGYLEIYFRDIDINRVRNSKVMLTRSGQAALELQKEMPNHILKFFIKKGTLVPEQLYKWELIDLNNIVLYRAYFRTSKYPTMLYKFEGKKVAVSKSKREGTIILDEPIDDIEWRNLKRKKFSYFGFPYTEYSNSNPFGSSELTYFFTKPVIVDIGQLAKENKTPLEIDHTLNVPFLIRMNQKEYKSNNNDLKYCLDYGAYNIKDTLVKDSIYLYPVVKNVKITEKDYKTNKIPTFSNPSIRFRLASMDIFERIIKNLKIQLLKRLDERAQYFYMTYKHIAIRENTPFTKTKEDFIKEQIEYAGPWMKKLLNDDTSYPLLLKYSVKFGISQTLDGESGYGVIAGMPIEWIE